MAVVSLSIGDNSFNVSGEEMTVDEMDIYEKRSLQNDITSRVRHGELTIEEAQNELDSMTYFETDHTSYGEAIKINLGGEHDFLVTKDSLEAAASIKVSNSYSTPDYNIQINGAERMVLSPEVIAGLDPNVFDHSEDLNAGNSWMQTGELFTFGDENNTRFILNNEYSNIPGVETLVIGDNEINFGDRMRELNELAASDSVADMAKRDDLMNGLYGDIKNAIIEAQSSPSLEMNDPSSSPNNNNIQTPTL